MITDEVRNKFWDAVSNNELPVVESMLRHDSKDLANTDFRSSEDRNTFTDGYPLHTACQQGFFDIAACLLQHGADPDAATTSDDVCEFGMPLHFAVCNKDYRLANLLLDHGASPNGFPYCDKATIEQLFFQAHESGLSEQLVRLAYSKYLPANADFDAESFGRFVDESDSEAVRLFAKFMEAGAEPPFTALVRTGFDDLLMEILAASSSRPGSPHDHPNGRVLDNVYGAARWFGYPELLTRIMREFPDQFDAVSAKDTINVAIGSHNRDGGHPEYRQIICAQLNLLKESGQLEAAVADPEFQPLHHMATDFCWHDNYGYKAKIVGPECYVDLAELFIEHGFDEVNFRHPKTGHTPLTAAISRGHHPGITTYIQFLIDNGANLRQSESEEHDPMGIAKSKGQNDIVKILQQLPK